MTAPRISREEPKLFYARHRRCNKVFRISAPSRKTKGEIKRKRERKKKRRKNIFYTPSGLVLDKFRTSWRRGSRRISKITYQQQVRRELD